MPQPEHVERKLVAILAADVVGYSRLMGADEVGTLRALKAQRRDVVDPAIASHGGRIVKTTGDGILADFPSVVDAVACAVAIQRTAMARNAQVPEDKRIMFRIGINVGDIIIDDHDIFGDGVNIAARLETLCEPGGLCISGVARDQVGGKLPLPFADLGQKTVKNIAEPVHAFGLSPEAIAACPELSLGRSQGRRPSYGGWIAAGAALVLIFTGAATWWVIRPVEQATTRAGAVPASMAANTPWPSIAMLPLVSMSDTSPDDYFADGLTEDIISALGRFSLLSVRARNSVLPYKGRTAKPEDVGRELEVRYIVEGSVRRSPDRVQISIRLTDAARGALLWAEHYDAKPKDIFAVQDDITRRITGALAVRVTRLEVARAAAKPADSLEAYELVLRARDLYGRTMRVANSEARTLFERAIELDPKYAPGYVGLGLTDLRAVIQGWTGSPVAALQRAESLGLKAISLDATNTGAFVLLGLTYLRRGEYARALDQLRRALELNSSDPEIYSGLGNALLWNGDLDDSIKALETAVRWQGSGSASDYFNLGTAQIVLGHPSDAVRILEHALVRYKTHLGINAILAAAYAEAARPDDAQRQADITRKLGAAFMFSDNFGSQFRMPEHREKAVSALRKAGL